MYVMIDECGNDRIIKAKYLNDGVITDFSGNKYQLEKVKYVWKKCFPIGNPTYIRKHLLEERYENT